MSFVEQGKSQPYQGRPITIFDAGMLRFAYCWTPVRRAFIGELAAEMLLPHGSSSVTNSHDHDYNHHHSVAITTAITTVTTTSSATTNTMTTTTGTTKFIRTTTMPTTASTTNMPLGR